MFDKNYSIDNSTYIKEETKITNNISNDIEPMEIDRTSQTTFFRKCALNSVEADYILSQTEDSFYMKGEEFKITHKTPYGWEDPEDNYYGPKRHYIRIKRVFRTRVKIVKMNLYGDTIIFEMMNLGKENTKTIEVDGYKGNLREGISESERVMEEQYIDSIIKKYDMEKVYEKRK